VLAGLASRAPAMASSEQGLSGPEGGGVTELINRRCSVCFFGRSGSVMLLMAGCCSFSSSSTALLLKRRKCHGQGMVVLREKYIRSNVAGQQVTLQRVLSSTDAAGGKIADRWFVTIKKNGNWSTTGSV
jgi:hypothetical protein